MKIKNKMINVMKEQNTEQSFFTKNKKWFVSNLIFGIFLIGYFIGIVVYS